MALALLLVPGVLLYGLYTASWQWPWGGKARAEQRQSVQVSTWRHSPSMLTAICQYCV